MHSSGWWRSTPAARKLFGNLDNRPCVKLTAFVQSTGVSVWVMEKKGEGPITAGLEKENLILSACVHMPLLGNCSRQTQLSRDSSQGLDFSIIFSTESPQEDPGSEVKFIYKSSLQTPNWAVLCGSMSSCGQGSDSLVTCSTKAWQHSRARQWMSQSKIAPFPPPPPWPHPTLMSWALQFQPRCI